MFRLASLFVEVGARTSPFDQALGGIRNRLSATGVALGTVAGNVATFALAKMGQGLAGAFDKTINSAMDLGETLSKVGTVFGPAAKEVTDQADAMAARFGLSKQPMLDAAAMFGLMAKGAGMSKEASAGFSNELVKLAADAASFYNVPMDQALEKIRAGLSGESEPLRAFGVFLTDDAMKAEALAMGLIKAGGEMTESQKILARQSLIMKGLSDATGDLERTEGSAANQSRKLMGSIGNLATDFGTVLLPLFEQGVQVVNGWADAVRAGFEGAKGTIAGWVAGIQEGFAVVGVLWRNLPIVWEMVVVKFREGVVNILNQIGTLPANLSIFANWLGNNWLNLIKDQLSLLLTYWTNLGKNIMDAWRAAMEFIRTGKIEFNATPLLEGFQAATAELPEFVKAEVFSAQEELDRLADQMARNEQKLADQKAEVAKVPAAGAAEQAAAAAGGKAFKSAEMDAADFGRKLRQQQYGEQDKVQQDQLKEQQGIRKAVEKLAAGVGVSPLAVFS